MRILTIGNMYPPHHMGGYEIVWQGAMREARHRGHDVRVLTTSHREPGIEGEDDPDVHRELEWYWSWEKHEWRQLGPLERLHLERRNRELVSRHVSDFAPDLVSFWSMGAMSMSLVERVARSRLPSVLVVHDDWLVYGPKRDAWMRLWSGRRRAAGMVAAPLVGIPTRLSWQRYERALFNSSFMLNRAREQGYWLPNTAVVTPGIGGEFLDPAPEREWGWRMLCVGRIDEQKGTDLAIAALAELPAEATLTIAGTGDYAYEAELRAQIADLGLDGRVELAGHVGHDDLGGLYAAADAVLFPVRWEEPFGLVPLEAMGRGRPVVATARGGASEYLRDGENAIVVPVDDPSAIAAAVRELAEDARLRDRLRGAGIETAAANTAERFERRIVDEHERALAGDRVEAP